ncbi:hypothetical protein FAZ19_13170 [Sphingobacterium alkalisoli]|uniref:Signal transduction histidine kinase internal region domain-containing protein n=1 Tax=Sphingobacterium alkalisoli TaxID=1874115 RepID=A0A4U0H2Z5_9SPHI|nr:histidine kinase [Sphingobacterium alkalisoli]TJY66037.1 hypothetical protein FAZ19_13170 [Sphingobacterium alkalisoli]GGH16637.1 hypothetical protein GCM10011418_19130 [Sphingobacterium alkalisoli]
MDSVPIKNLASLRKLKVALAVGGLLLLWLYLYQIVPHAFQGAKEFFTLLAFHVGIFVSSRWFMAPQLQQRKARLTWWFIVYALQLMVFTIAIIAFSFWQGALKFTGLKSFYISNFYHITFTFLIPSVLGLTHFFLRSAFNRQKKREASQKREEQLEAERAREHEASMELEKQLRDALFKWNQQRLMPHLVFNTLTTIEELNRIQHPEASKAIEILGTISRFYMTLENQLFVSLTDELEQVDRLLQIYIIRKSKAIYIEQHIDRSTPARRIPALLIFNLLENTCQYGIITQQAKPASLTIKPWNDHGVHIVVFNHMAARPLPEVKQGHGQLEHMEKTLKLLHPENQIHIIIDSNTFTVELFLHGEDA